MSLLTARHDLERVLRDAETLAVLGAHVEPARAACYVPDYLHEQGYRVFGVNPALVGQLRWATPFVATLADLKEPVDVVDVFRRSSLVASHLAEILGMQPLPGVVWLQLGVRADIEAALSAAGVDLVQNRCTLADHRAFGIGPRSG